jgi:hypothetical protein
MSTTALESRDQGALKATKKRGRCQVCGKRKFLVTPVRCADCVSMSVAQRRVYIRRYQKARQRAQARLQIMYPGVYERVFDEEMDALVALAEAEQTG